MTPLKFFQPQPIDSHAGLRPQRSQPQAHDFPENTLKITGSNEPLRTTRSGANATGTSGAAAPTGTGQVESTIHLSGVAAKLAKLMDETQAPEASFDQARVDAIKEAIRRGEFRVDAEVVADRLLSSVQELMGNKD